MELAAKSEEPFNAEPPRQALVSSYVTPTELFYKRNHGPIPVVDDIERYSVFVTGLIEKPKELFMKDITNLPKYNVTATLQCAGNRRTAMSKTQTVKGVGWDVSALGNAIWGGAKLADVLELVGISKFTSVTPAGGKHVEFVSVDRCKEENGGPYKASIPLIQATNPEADVLLAYEMNGETLNRDHGYPLRVVVPGVIGARSVKWLDTINIDSQVCQGFFMQKDYKMFPPSVNWDNIDWSTRRPQMDFPVQSAICSLEDVNVGMNGKEQDLDFVCGFGSPALEDQILKDKDPIFTQFQQDLLWEEDELYSLLSKEKITHLICDESLMGLRKESVDWINRVGTHYGFVALTTILAVNYFDRFLVSGSFQKDKPWMNQLVAVACLSLASKVEEIQAPLLLDLQMEGSKFVFEAKTIMKMELLVLSSLEWKMNPVTPIAFFDYIMRRLGLMTHNLHYEFLRRCERILLSVINDFRFQGFLPSVMAGSIMCIVSKEIEPDNVLDYRNQLMNLLNFSEEIMDRCSKFIMDVSNNHGSCYFQTHKRKFTSVPGSPSGVVDAYFSSDNSNNSWAIASSVSSSPEVQFKKNRAQEQQMRLTPVNRVPIAVLSNPH